MGIPRNLGNDCLTAQTSRVWEMGIHGNWELWEMTVAEPWFILNPLYENGDWAVYIFNFRRSLTHPPPYGNEEFPEIWEIVPPHRTNEFHPYTMTTA